MISIPLLYLLVFNICYCFITAKSFKFSYYDENGSAINQKNNQLFWLKLESNKLDLWIKLESHVIYHIPTLIKKPENKSTTHDPNFNYQSNNNCLYKALTPLISYDKSFFIHDNQSEFQFVNSIASLHYTKSKLSSIPFIISFCNGINGIVSTLNIHGSYKAKIHSEVGTDTINVSWISNPDQILEGFQKDVISSSMYQRSKRSIMNMPVRRDYPGPYLVELYIIIDRKLAVMYKNDKYYRLLQRITFIINQINLAYSQLNIFFSVVQLEIWEHDQIKLTNENHILMELQLYKIRYITTKHDCLHAILGENLGAARRGQAELESMCGYNTCVGYTKDFWGLNELEIAHSVMHEIGHNFGLHHDTEQCNCYGCVMATGVEFGSLKFEWSSCSKKEILSVLKAGMADCLSDYPNDEHNELRPEIMGSMNQRQKLDVIDLTKCGNGVVDKGEQCDCGGSSCPKEALNCCNPKTCQFTFNSYCASGPCCDIKSCKLKSAGTICRGISPNKTSIYSLLGCDLPEYCTGDSEWCPRDVYKQDGQECQVIDTGEYSRCYHGKCESHLSRCRTIWGKTGQVANSYCFRLNSETTNDQVQNCGLIVPSQSHRVRLPNYWEVKNCVNKEDEYCGRLWCNQESERVMKLSSQTEVHKLKYGYYCSAVRFNLDWYLDDAGLAPNMVSCGHNKVCMKGVCTEYSKVAPTKQCNCNGHGVCNNLGNCHCDAGFAPPDCIKPGHGGSINSGPVLQFNFVTRTVLTVVFILIIVLLTSLIIGILVYHYRKKQWPGLIGKIISQTNQKKSRQTLPAPDVLESNKPKDKRPSTILSPKSPPQTQQKNNNNYFFTNNYHKNEPIYANTNKIRSPPPPPIVQKKSSKPITPSNIKEKARLFEQNDSLKLEATTPKRILLPPTKLKPPVAKKPQLGRLNIESKPEDFGSRRSSSLSDILGSPTKQQQQQSNYKLKPTSPLKSPQKPLISPPNKPIKPSVSTTKPIITPPHIIIGGNKPKTKPKTPINRNLISKPELLTTTNTDLTKELHNAFDKKSRNKYYK